MKTERRRKVIHSVLQSLKSGSSLWDACKAAGVNYTTFWLWRRKWPKLELICESIYTSRIHMVEDALFKNCLQGNFQAQAYFLNNRTGKWKSNEGLKVVQQTNVYQGEKKETDGVRFEGEDRALVESIRQRVIGEIPQK